MGSPADEQHKMNTASENAFSVESTTSSIGKSYKAHYIVLAVSIKLVGENGWMRDSAM